MRPKVGEEAPNFEARDQDGTVHRLVEYRGQKVVLYFYPKDQTPGCTKQACNLRDHHKLLTEAGYVVLGVSKDSVGSHQKFAEKERLPFRLLSDPDKVIHKSYGTWVEKKLYGKSYMGTDRVTFVIDKEGKVVRVIAQVKTGDHTAQILESSSAAS